MINISECKEDSVITSILHKEEIWENITEYNTPKGEVLLSARPDMKAFLVKEDEEVVGLFIIRNVTSLCAELHSSFFVKGVVKRAFLALSVWLLNNTTYDHLITFVPEHNKTAYNAAINNGFKEEGFIPNSFRWESNQPEGQFILGVDL